MSAPWLRGRRLRISLAFTGAAAWVLQGYDQALMNGLLSLPSFTRDFPSIDTSTPALAAKNSTLQGTVVGLFEVGAACGALSCYVLGDWYGRKWTTFYAAVIAFVGIVVQTTSFQLAQLIIGRTVTGLGVGVFTATLPSWVAESSGAHQRGALILLEGTGSVFGLMFAGWLELGLYFVKDNEVSWRFPTAVQAIFLLYVLGMTPFLEESPRWLVAKDRMEDARKVLAKLKDEPEDSANVVASLQEIRFSVELDHLRHSKNPFALTANCHLHRTLIAIGVNMLAQLSGVNVIVFYSTNVFEGLGYSAVLSRVISGCLQTWQLFTATAAVFLVDRWGRRKLLMLGAALMMVSNAGLAGLEYNPTGPARGYSLIFYFLALLAFPIGLFLIPFVYASEIAPLPIRSQITAMSGATHWLINFMIAEVTPVAFDTIHWKYYLVYVCTNAFAVLAFYLFLPETKNSHLEDIDAYFIMAKNPLQVVKLARANPNGIAELPGTVEKGDSGAEMKETVV